MQTQSTDAGQDSHGGNNSQTFLRKIAVVLIALAGVPLMAGTLLLAAAGSAPPEAAWWEHRLEALLILGAGLIVDGAGVSLLVASLQPETAHRVASSIRKMMGRRHPSQ